MLRALLSLGVMLAIGCAEEGADDASCETLCGVLVGQCEFAAYPSSDTPLALTTSPVSTATPTSRSLASFGFQCALT